MKRNYEYLLSDLSLLKGVGTKTSNLLKKKKVNTIFDLLWKLPKSYTDRSLSSKIKDLKIDEIQTITIIPLKYSFPRVRNLPNRVLCKDDTGEIDCVFFNSYEGYIKKILPIGKEVTISGKIKYFRNHSDLCLAGEDKEFINKFMTKSGQTIFKPALAQDIFSKEDFV